MSRDSNPPEQYLAGMRVELALLLGIAERLAATGNDRGALAQLQREIRKIEGTAGSHGFVEASRLAAGMEATVNDWASRPDEQDVDRGSVTLWFVTRLAAMLKLEMPRRAGPPRPKPTGSPAPPSPTPAARPPIAQRPSSPPSPSSPPPPLTPPPRLIIRRPSAPQAPPGPPPPTGPKRPRDLVPAVPPPDPVPPAVPTPAPPPPVSGAQGLTWLIPPDADKSEDSAEPETPEPPAVEAPEPPAAAAPPTPEPPPAEATASPAPPAPEPPPAAEPPTPEPELADAGAAAAPPAPEPSPAAEPPTPEPQPAEATASAAPPAPQAASTAAEVIFVEDDAALAGLLEYGLRSRGYRFLAYRNGRDALRELLALDVQGTRPLLLLDVDLPALDGYSIFDALQRERPGTYRVVFTTVHGSEEEQLRGLEAGALDYMVKPISLRVALEKIKRWVGR